VATDKEISALEMVSGKNTILGLNQFKDVLTLHPSKTDRKYIKIWLKFHKFKVWDDPIAKCSVGIVHYLIKG